MVNKSILFVGGGTLGHLAPTVPVIKELKNKYPSCKIYFFTTNKDTEKEYIKKNLGRYLSGMYSFDLLGFKRKIFRLESIKYNLKSFKKYMKIKKKINKELENIKPDIIIGMGGYISGFVLRKAKKMNVSLIIHEQNAILGLSNKIVARNVDKILLSFPINKMNKKYLKKAKIVGNPAINEVLLYKNMYFEKKNNVLVLSGSMGSSLINNYAIDTALNMKQYQFTIVTGKKYYKDNQEKIKSLKGEVNIIPFSNDVKKLMKESSLIISRCGSSTIFEIMGLEKPSILIPSTYVSDNHQLLNSNVLKEKNQAVILYEDELSVNKLKENIESINNSYNKRNEIINNIRKDNYMKSLDNFLLEIEEYL